MADADRDALDRSLDLMLRENALFGQRAKSTQLAPVWAEVLRCAGRTPMGQAFFTSSRARSQGNAVAESDPQQAVDWFRLAVDVLYEALQHAHPTLAFHWEVMGEHLLALFTLGQVTAEVTFQAFAYALQRDPSFLPALTESAKLAMEEGDLARTQQLLDAAGRLFPAHGFVSYVQHECRRRRTLREQQHIVDFAAAYAGQRWDDAAQRAAELDALGSTSGIGAYAVGVLALSQGRFEDASSQLQRAVEAGDGLFEWACTWARAQAASGQALAAWETLTIAIGGAAHAVLSDDIAGHSSPYIPYGSRAALRGAIRYRNRLAAQLGLISEGQEGAANERPEAATDEAIGLHWPAVMEIEVKVSARA